MYPFFFGASSGSRRASRRLALLVLRFIAFMAFRPMLTMCRWRPACSLTPLTLKLHDEDATTRCVLILPRGWLGLLERQLQDHLLPSLTPFFFLPPDQVDDVRVEHRGPSEIRYT